MNRRLSLLVLLLPVFKWFRVIPVFFFIAGGDNLVRNGGFESGQFVDDPNEAIVRGTNCKMLCGGSTALDNWQVFRLPVRGNQSCDNAKDAICWVKTPNTLNINAQSGDFDVDLTGFNGRSPQQFGRVRQSIENTQPGHRYELSFYVGSSKMFLPPKNAKVGILVDVASSSGASIVSRSFDAIQNGKQSNWVQYSIDFKAADQLTTITFTGSEEPVNSEVGSDHIGLDNVVLKKMCFFLIAELYGC